MTRMCRLGRVMTRSSPAGLVHRDGINTRWVLFEPQEGP